MILKIAIVEDDLAAQKRLAEYLNDYERKQGSEVVLSLFEDGESFLEKYHRGYHAIFMDIQMPGRNGMEIAKELRKIDSDVFLIFVTDLAQYALLGYEVDAYDFIVKPVVSEHLFQKMDKLAAYFAQKSREPKIQIKVDDGLLALTSSDIKYIEIMDHRLFYHTDKGTFSAYGSLSEAEKILPKDSFVRCNHCYLVNLKYVTGIHGYVVDLGKDHLQISHPKKRLFLDSFTKYLGSCS